METAMFQKKHRFCIYLLILTLGVIPAAAQTRARISRLDSVISRFPAESSEVRDALAEELLGLGPEALLDACRRLLPAGPRSDAKVRFALHAAAVYVTQEGAGEKRKSFARAILKALKDRQNSEVKAFLIRHLEMTGGQESIKPLAGYLDDPSLCGPAAKALLAIKHPGVEKAFIKALKKSKNKTLITLVKSLGELRSTEAVGIILPLAESRDAEIRGAVRTALACIGDPRAAPVLEHSLITASAYERLKAPADYLVFARRLGETGRRDQAVSICRNMIENYSGGSESRVACTALSLLSDLLGDDAFSDLLDAMDSPSRDLRGLSLRLADRIPGREATEKWMGKAKALSPSSQAEVIAMLGRRRDQAALPLVKEALQSPEQVVRLAAIGAASGLGRDRFLDDLIALLLKAGELEAPLLKEVFLTMDGAAVIPKMVDVFSELNPLSKASVVEVLSERRASEHRSLAFELAGFEQESIRRRALAALENLSAASDVPRLIQMLLGNKDSAETVLIQNALVAACVQIPDPSLRAQGVLETMEGVQPEAGIDLIRTLPKIGGSGALEKVTALLDDESSGIRTAAAAALSQWRDGSASPALLMLAAAAENDKLSYLAVQGYVRLIIQSDLIPDEKVEALYKIRPLLSSAGETKMFLSGLGGVKSPKALETIQQYFEVEDQREEVVRDVLRIVMPEPEVEGLRGPEAIAALDRIFGLIENEFRREEVETYMQELLREEGFMPLFNGWDLNGWMGGIEGYVPENEEIVIYPERGSGNLYTEKEYSDFVFRFDFKLTPGANNGLGIRTPPQGDAAYVGMELQILDNAAEKYADLEPYQYHGSIYGIAPAKRGFLRPVGEWNRQEVTVRGSRVTVRLNGVVITDIDITEAAAGGTMDGRDHPGLSRDTGHIGFLGHGSRVEFRNIFIKELRQRGMG
jgi:HEAT repeat protein